MAFNILSLCSGVGGLELGLEAAIPRSRVLCYVERDSFAASVLLARMEDSSLRPAPIWCGNLADVDWLAFTDQVHCLTAGFPCQPFSVAGRMEGEHDERFVWDDIATCIHLVRPPLIFLENVPGITVGGLPHILTTLAKEGYDASWTCLRATPAPHHRERFFLLAYPKRTRLPLWESLSGHNGAQCPTTERVRLFPPGPDDIEGWRELLRSQPETQPALRRDADGMAERVDRLRACGNGVIPLQAARAFITLYRAIPSMKEFPYKYPTLQETKNPQHQ